MATDKEKFGDRVHHLRKIPGWSQAELAERIGRQPNAIQRLESGNTGPSLDGICRLAEAFGMSPSQLLEGIGPSAATGRSDALDGIVGRLSGLSQAELESMRRLIDAGIDLLRTK